MTLLNINVFSLYEYVIFMFIRISISYFCQIAFAACMHNVWNSSNCRQIFRPAWYLYVGINGAIFAHSTSNKISCWPICTCNIAMAVAGVRFGAGLYLYSVTYHMTGVLLPLSLGVCALSWFCCVVLYVVWSSRWGGDSLLLIMIFFVFWLMGCVHTLLKIFKRIPDNFP